MVTLINFLVSIGPRDLRIAMCRIQNVKLCPSAIIEDTQNSMTLKLNKLTMRIFRGKLDLQGPERHPSYSASSSSHPEPDTPIIQTKLLAHN